MDFRIIIGIIIGVAATATVTATAIWWRRGRALRSGKRGERMVAKELGKLRRKDYIVINDMLVATSNGRTSQIDHVVVSTRGIFVIETKNHAGRIAGGEHSQYWQQHLRNESKSMYNPLLQNLSHLRAIRRLLPTLDKNFFSSMVVFTNAWRLDIKADEIIESRRFLSDKHIQRTLIPAERQEKRWWRRGKEVVLDERKMATLIDGMLDEMKRRPRIIDRDEIEAIAEKLIKANITNHAARQQHTQYARETARNISAEIKRGLCPRCGGQLIVRKGQKGNFVGCSRYPECRFTCSIDRLHS